MPEKFNIVRQCRHGLMVFNRHDQFIGKALKVYGEYSEGEYDVFSQVVKPGDTVIEAGANLGAHTLGLAQLAGPNGRVYAFEPQRLMFQTLLGNAALNSLTNIYGFQKALSNAPGKLLVPLQDCEKEVNWGGLALGSCSEGEEVEVITIDSLKLSACDFIKVDVEGMELPVLQGASAAQATKDATTFISWDLRSSSRAEVSMAALSTTAMAAGATPPAAAKII